MRKTILFFMIIALFAGAAHASSINPKSVDSIIAKVTQSGTVSVDGYITEMNLTVYIPQEGIQDISVSPDSWRYVRDSFGNRQVMIVWSNVRETVHYKIETIINNSASSLPSEKGIGSNDFFLKETPQIVFSDEERKIAYPYEKTLRRAAELSAWVNEYVTYDPEYAGRRLSSDKVLKERRGVCVEHANLLASLLRISGIPAKYATGYAYSTVDNKFIGHAWVEVLLDDGTWVGLDPTWDEAGYIDAMHIKTAEMLDENQTEVISYTGNGKVNWTHDEEVVELIEYHEGIPVSISVGNGSFTENGYGFVKASISSGCMLSVVSINPCINSEGSQMLDVYENERKVWSCGRSDIYWFFKPKTGREYGYTCPISIYEQTGARSVASIEIAGQQNAAGSVITGPDTVSVGEMFELSPGTDSGGIFYSTTLNERHESGTWKLSMKRPGNYMFYLYSAGALGIKNVSVNEKNDFSISASAPKNATLGSSFLVSVRVENLDSMAKRGKLSLETDGAVHEKDFSISPEGTYSTYFNVTASGIGVRKITVSAMNDSIAAYSTQVLVYEHREKTIFDNIADFFSGIAKSIADFFSSIF